MPFGVGAIYDVFGESFAACDIGLWGQKGNRISSPAIERQLKVSGLRSAPTLEDQYHGIPYVRFPAWLFCQKCRTLFQWRRDNERTDEPAICVSCPGRRQLVPMRFVTACKAGHLGEVPWNIWAHSGTKSGSVAKCDHRTLQFRGRSTEGSGLGSLVVECKKCRASRSLAGITAKDSLSRLRLNCRGTQPWQRHEPSRSCAEEPKVIPRSASNIYFAHIVSSIDIPNPDAFDDFDEDRAAIENHKLYGSLEFFIERGDATLTGPMAMMQIETIASDCKVDPEIIRSLLLKSKTPAPIRDEMLHEWLALRNPRPDPQNVRADFMSRRSRLSTIDLKDQRLHRIVRSFADVVLVTRLKEVRALRGFSRIDPASPMLRPDLTTESQARKIDWAPAAVVYGEGIFLTLDESRLEEWESRPAVVARTAKIQENIRDSALGKSILRQRLGTDHVLSRFVLLHTLAHLLIRELCFECGYSSASLNERIYSRGISDGVAQAGVLIYTAAGDSEGTFGGLVRQGEPPRLLAALVHALETARWCSADPICRESGGQGYDRTNLAACHACSLLPETSCVAGNMLLDRALVIDSAANGVDNGVEFFSDPYVPSGDRA